MFVRTTAINKIRQMKARKKIIPGGTSAGKTFGILPILIDQAAKEPNKEISVVSESIPHLRRGALKDFKKIMRATGRWVEGRFNETHLTYRFANGSYIEFFSADQEERLRGARRHKLYVNEANNINFEAYHQLAIRTSEDIYIDFNPTAEFWAYTEVLKEDDSELVILTYKDNEALPQTIVKDIEAARTKGFHNPEADLNDQNNIKNSFWANWWKVYGLGQVGSLDGVVFGNWQIIPELPINASFEAAGMDFGYTNDPTTLIGYHRHDNRRVFDEMIYQKGLQNSEIAKLSKAEGIGRVLIYADSAEPKSIDELKGYGLNITGATKGKDSINYGISLLQEEPFYVTARSVNLIKELRAYTWAKDKTGGSLNTPIDAFNHCLDPMRYIAMSKLNNKPIPKRARAFNF